MRISGPFAGGDKWRRRGRKLEAASFMGSKAGVDPLVQFQRSLRLSAPFQFSKARCSPQAFDMKQLCARHPDKRNSDLTANHQSCADVSSTRVVVCCVDVCGVKAPFHVGIRTQALLVPVTSLCLTPTSHQTLALSVVPQQPEGWHSFDITP